MSDESKQQTAVVSPGMVQSALSVATTVKNLTAREFRVFVLMLLGYVMFEYSDKIAMFMNQAELAPVVFKAGLIAFAMAFARVLIRIFFPWLDLSRVIDKASEEPVGAAVIGFALVMMVIEMFKLLAVV